MNDITQLCQQHEIQDDSSSILGRSELIIGQVTETEYHQHKPPLGRADAAYKSDRAFVNQPRKRKEQEHIDGDKNNKHAVPANVNPIELHRNRQIGPQKQSAVCLPRLDHREVFPQGEET